MDTFLMKLKNYTRTFYWLFVFLFTSVLLFLVMPGEPRFKYEYQKGFPWNHENLVAPFDFAILKTPAEIEKEKTEQLESVIPYFSFDTTLVNQKLNLLKSDWQAMTDSMENPQPEIFTEAESAIRDIYKIGILARSAETYPELTGKEELKKRAGNTVSKIQTEKIYSEKSAYNELNNTFRELAGKYPGAKDLLLKLKPEKFIVSNLSYDSGTTQKEKDEAVKNISATRGMLQTGERIILEGEIVNDEKFQILESLKASYESERGEGIDRYIVSFGKGTLTVIFMVLLFTFLYIYRFDILNRFSKLSFLLLFLVSIIFLSIFIDSFPNLHIYLVPFAIFPIVVRTFFDSRTAIFTMIIASLITGFFAPNNYEFVLLQVTAGVVAVFSLNKMHRRGHLIMAAIWVLLTYSLVYISLELVHEGDFLSVNYKTMQWFVLSSILILLVYPLVFIFEKIFGFVSDVTLIELSDTNQPLLRKLAEEAPGTFQHSMQIANLAEEIILKIGGNPFLVRAGALYHDIGKIARPEFFIENQAVGINPHDKMDHLKSAEIIINHVKNGVRMAKRHKLPEALVEFIATHHGTTKAQYFYLKHQEENPDTKVDEASFIYPGPLPRTKEAAVVMIVDGIEAASRSLPEKTLENLKGLTDKMIDQKIRDKQLEQSDLTFRDIKIIKETLLNKLVNIYHVRIEYPKEQESNTMEKK
ncbi:HDIG domain-containing protein [Mariniphaga sediminis]|uniref:HDIG domain-containing protein n=1 Tax=Mariniphaga sediminis TaxID=1628158 RepID=A0A399CTX4_9BACT|nr:HDIG domain-containing metalloprotein [Mariniphaga sediminis]RIH62786.1 HDIG domain-containing protein [Mariniphaga sediminis]